jgi:hypothetical protein
MSVRSPHGGFLSVCLCAFTAFLSGGTLGSEPRNIHPNDTSAVNHWIPQPILPARGASAAVDIGRPSSSPTVSNLKSSQGPGIFSSGGRSATPTHGQQSPEPVMPSREFFGVGKGFAEAEEFSRPPEKESQQKTYGKIPEDLMLHLSESLGQAQEGGSLNRKTQTTKDARRLTDIPCQRRLSEQFGMPL